MNTKKTSSTEKTCKKPKTTHRNQWSITYEKPTSRIQIPAQFHNHYCQTLIAHPKSNEDLAVADTPRIEPKMDGLIAATSE